MSARQDRRVKRRTLNALPDPYEDPIAIGVGIDVVEIDVVIAPYIVCHYCRERQATTRDHVVPRASLGSDAWWNLVPACKACNARKAESMPTCQCAYCNRAVFLFKLGHVRPKHSPRARPRELRPAPVWKELPPGKGHSTL